MGPDAAPAEGLAQALADVAGRTFQSAPGQTWVRLRTLSQSQYAENEASVEATELPVFVNVLKRQVPPKTELEREIAALAKAIAKMTGRSVARIHIQYAPAAVGRLSFGGKIVE